MNWDRLAEEPEEYSGRRDRESSDESPYRCLRAAGFVGLTSLLLFNAVAISRIQGDMETRVAASEAATMARITELERQVAVLRAANSHLDFRESSSSSGGSSSSSSIISSVEARDTTQHCFRCLG